MGNSSENSYVEELLIELSLKEQAGFWWMCWLGSAGVEEGIPRQEDNMNKVDLSMLLLGRWDGDNEITT